MFTPIAWLILIFAIALALVFFVAYVQWGDKALDDILRDALEGPNAQPEHHKIDDIFGRNGK